MGHSRPESLLREVGWSIGLTTASPDKENPDEDSSGEADWGKVFTTILAQTSMSYEDILNRTIPQIEAIMENLPEQMSIKLGIPFSGKPKAEAKEEHSVEDGFAFAAMFKGIG